MSALSSSVGAPTSRPRSCQVPAARWAWVRGLAAAGAAVLLAADINAAAIQRDLGDGLIYFRVHSVPADLPTDESARRRPTVLDLRYAHADSSASSILAAWLKFHASPKTPVFVLENGSTAPGLLHVLENREDTPGLLVIGIDGQSFEPDITVTESTLDEKRAYDALEHGTSVAALTTDNPDKQRNDEASLAHEHSPEPSDDSDSAVEKGPVEKAPPVIDAALQRAIHLHRALRALKKI